MSDHPLDIVISRLGEGYYVGPRDQRRMGMRFEKHSEAVKWAHGIAMGRAVIDKTKRLAFAPRSRGSRYAGSDITSTPKRAHTITVRKEPERYSRTGHAFRAYYEDGTPMYLGGETLDECVRKVREDHPGHRIVKPKRR